MLRPSPHRPDRARLTHSVPHLTRFAQGVVTLAPQVEAFLACSAIHCCFVYVLVELRVSSSVSHQWFCADDAPLPSSGSRWPRFPAFSGTIRALRLPAPACPSAYCFRHPAPQAPAGVRVRHGRSRRHAGPTDGPGSMLVTPAAPLPASLPAGKSRISQVPWRSIP